MGFIQLNKPTRSQLYLCYCIEMGAVKRWGSTWATDDPERVPRLQREVDVIIAQHFEDYFLILAQIMDWMRSERIVYGPGRGSVGGSLAAYCLHIHEADSLEFGLIFERFMNPDRVAYPDVDIDVSQRHRQRVLAHIRQAYENERFAVLQVAAFARAGARSVIDMMAAAKQQEDPDAMGIAESLKKLLPEGANITGGTKQEREIAYWLENGKESKNQLAFREMAQKAGWLDTMLKLDGIQTHLTSHAAGVVIISREDLARLPQTSADGQTMMTGYDMYALDELKYLKIDILGLRTLDILADADKSTGSDGTTPHLVDLWRRQRDSDTLAYEILCDADTMGVFQVETSGYRRTLKDFQPRNFEHIVQLNALYRPGALDYKRKDGKNMVEVFIERLHGREPIAYAQELKPVLAQVLGPTQGIILFQEQAMELSRRLAGFSDAEADNLRKAIGKKQLDRMAAIQGSFVAGMLGQGYSQWAADTIWSMISAAARYSWNRSHSVFYGLITFLCAHFKANHRAAFYAALINSLEGDKDRQANAVAEARQHVPIRPPDINVALESWTVDGEGIVFGLNGIKGMGEANRAAIILERTCSGPFASFEDFHRRLPSVPINMKLALIKCGAFDELEQRSTLLATAPRPTPKDPDRRWTVAEFTKHNCSLAKPRPLPDITEMRFPSQRELTDGEMEAIGFYVSEDPMADVNQALKRLDPSMHWGGQVEAIKVFNDRNGKEMARFTLLTPGLTKQRCMVFQSDWPQCQPLVCKGARVIVRGRMDGSQVLGERVFTAGDYRHFHVLYLTRDGHTEKRVFDGKLETVLLAEKSGYKVRLR